MKTKTIKEVYSLIKSAKLSRMEDRDKFIIIRDAHLLKGVSDAYDELMRDAVDRLKKEGYDERLSAALKFERDKVGNYEDYKKFLAENKELNDALVECSRAEAEKENDVNLEKLSQAAFEKFVASNDFTVEQVLTLQEKMTE